MAIKLFKIVLPLPEAFPWKKIKSLSAILLNFSFSECLKAKIAVLANLSRGFQSQPVRAENVRIHY